MRHSKDEKPLLVLFLSPPFFFQFALFQVSLDGFCLERGRGGANARVTRLPVKTHFFFSYRFLLVAPQFHNAVPPRLLAFLLPSGSYLTDPPTFRLSQGALAPLGVLLKIPFFLSYRVAPPFLTFGCFLSLSFLHFQLNSIWAPRVIGSGRCSHYCRLDLGVFNGSLFFPCSWLGLNITPDPLLYSPQYVLGRFRAVSGLLFRERLV